MLTNVVKYNHKLNFLYVFLLHLHYVFLHAFFLKSLFPESPILFTFIPGVQVLSNSSSGKTTILLNLLLVRPEPLIPGALVQEALILPYLWSQEPQSFLTFGSGIPNLSLSLVKGAPIIPYLWSREPQSFLMFGPGSPGPSLPGLWSPKPFFLSVPVDKVLLLFLILRATVLSYRFS